MYPKLLGLLRPFSTPKSATLLGWHAEGPFIDLTKRGAHNPSYLLPAGHGFKSFEEVYGTDNLVESEDWYMSSLDPAVRLITAAPEIPGVMKAIDELVRRGIAVSIGHRYDPFLQKCESFSLSNGFSVASTKIATTAIQHGARLITHLFNAMPQLHHRDPAIIGLLGASPHLSSPKPISVHLPCNLAEPPPLDISTPIESATEEDFCRAVSEAFDQSRTLPKRTTTLSDGKLSLGVSAKSSRPALHLEKGQIADMPFKRPYYGIIVDGIHCHPNSVRVRTTFRILDKYYPSSQLAYSSHPEGCILITDGLFVPFTLDEESDNAPIDH